MKKWLLMVLLLFSMGVFTEMNAQSRTPRILVAYFSWGGNTRGIARQIHQRTGGDLFEIELVNPYSRNYSTCVDDALRDQRANARPALKTHVGNMAQYDVIILGYPNWWASIPMPVASFLEEYDFAGKTVIPFCSHGGGRFGQSLTVIAKLISRAKVGDALSVHYSGGSSLSNDISAWLRRNGIAEHN
jgi:flavodoxin